MVLAILLSLGLGLPLIGEPRPAGTATLASATDGAFARRLDEVCQRVAAVVQQQLPRLAHSLEKRGLVRLQIRHQFYDPQFRRVFVEFAGSVRFNGQLPGKIRRDEIYLTSDGDIAYDLFIDKVTPAGSGVEFAFRGDLVIFFDKILYDLAKTLPHLAGAFAFSAAGDLLVDFLRGLDLEILGQAISDTCAKFSLDYLSVIGAEVLAIIGGRGSPGLRESLKRSIRNGGVANFFVLTLLKSLAQGAATFTGATVGATLGNLLVPGPGAVVGAYLGSKATMLVARTAIYYLTVDFPITILLSKMVKFYERQRRDPADQTAAQRVAGYGATIFRKVKREVDQSVYKTFDELLEKIDGFAAGERPAFIGLLQDIREALRFRVIDLKDWYAAKKMNQMRLRLEKWGLFGQFRF
ncbi:MAG: hypothetical protein OZSIB_2590 [Candidatus Ozemobacter sibiricus]|uniref:Uncharacterized protein n=1 Tax=Candidatus Ozemobacter sibiricus TaxID=2268124 RepID=A0A367ZKF4_9BACT|nr:MAG: hypothetical protein OZSIB_2590 [Candidatus Ozemobacter sibiricus]